MPSFHTPDGKKVKAKTVTEKRTAYNFYFNKILVPWFTEYIKPWHIEYVTKYLRGGTMCYWGAVIAKPPKNGKKVANGAPIKRTIRARKFDEDKKAAYIELILGGNQWQCNCNPGMAI